MRRKTRCALLGGLLGLLLGLLFLPLAKGSIDSGLAASATAGLDDAGVSGVAVASDWADLTLRGPSAAKDAALAAVATMDHRGSVDAVTYIATDSGQPAANSTSPAADGSVDVSVQLDSSASPKKLTLSGFVADDAQRVALVTAANNAVGAPNVTDKLTVSGKAVPAEVGLAVERLGALVGALSSGGVTGSMSLKDTALTVNGSTADAQDAANANNALSAAAAAGVNVSGKISATATANSGVQDELKNIALKGITFRTGSAELTTQGESTLDEAAAVLAKHPDVKIEIAGYTDNTGDSQANLSLSAARADTVKQYLITKGIAQDRLTAKGYGQANPVADNNTSAGRQANRRIELTIVGS